MSNSHGSSPEPPPTGRRANGKDTRVVSDGDRRERMLTAAKEQYGGIKVGSAFFGWLTATGTTIVLTALLAGAGASVGLATNTDAQKAADSAQTIGLVGGIAALVVLLVAYFCGGYVAGRMARFNGAKQGVAVWLWGLLITIIVAILGAVAGSKLDLSGQLNSLPRVPGIAGILALVAAAVVSLVGAVLGGLAGMRFHRRVDKAALAS